MSRSTKKPFVTLTPKWDQFCERSFRNGVRQQLNEYRGPFDPDMDWDEYNMSQKGLEGYGTRMGFDIPPDEDDERGQEEYKRSMRK